MGSFVTFNFHSANGMWCIGYSEHAKHTDTLVAISFTNETKILALGSDIQDLGNDSAFLTSKKTLLISRIAANTYVQVTENELRIIAINSTEGMNSAELVTCTHRYKRKYIIHNAVC